MAITITSHTRVYAPWVEGDDERELIDTDESTHVIEDEDIADALAEGDTLPAYVASILTDGRGSGCYAVFASDWPTVSARTWYSAEPYEHPHTGELTEVSYHLDGPEWTDELARDVAAIAKWSA